jgi:ABC-type lipoprotein release transport system permease subunit
VKPRIFTRAIVTIAAIGTIVGYLGSHGLSVKVQADRESMAWTVETKAIEWQPIAVSSLILAALYTGRIDWVINVAEHWAKRAANTNDISQGKK